MPTPTALYLNELDLGTLGFVVEAVDGLRDGPSVKWPTVTLPGRAGALVLDGRPSSAPRQITIHGTLRGGTVAGLMTALGQLQGVLRGGALELRAVDTTDRMVLCRYRERSTVGTFPQLTSPDAKVVIALEAADPYWYARQPTMVVGPAAFRVSCPLGAVPSAPVTQILGAATNPVLTYRNSAGDSQGTMGFTVTLASTDYLEIDHHHRRITTYASGVSSDGTALFTSGDWLTLYPEDGDSVLSVWPTLETSAGSLVVSYRKAWTG
jgi:hypothetical protein